MTGGCGGMGGGLGGCVHVIDEREEQVSRTCDRRVGKGGSWGRWMCSSESLLATYMFVRKRMGKVS